MNAKNILAGVGAVFLVLFVFGIVSGFMSSVPATNPEATKEPTYMGLTRQEYLDTVSNNGQDKASLCAYTYLIDTYGLEETYKIDYRASKDENDIDPRTYEALEECI